MNATSIIITETPNGSGFVKSAYRCDDEAGFIAQVSQAAARSDAQIDTVDDAISYQNDAHAQRTAIVTYDCFRELPTYMWDTPVLEQAEKLGWRQVVVAGRLVDFRAAVNLMDDDIRESLHADMAPCDDQVFVDAYAIAHAAEFFGVKFVVN